MCTVANTGQQEKLLFATQCPSNVMFEGTPDIHGISASASA